MTRPVPCDSWDNEVLVEINPKVNPSKYDCTLHLNQYLCTCVWPRHRTRRGESVWWCTFGCVLQLQWSLSLSDQLIVALEDASLIQMNTAMRGPDITVQGRRREVLSPVKVRGLPAHTAHCHLVANRSVTAYTQCLVDAGDGIWRGILGLEAGQRSVCLQYGGHMSKRWVARSDYFDNDNNGS